MIETHDVNAILAKRIGEKKRLLHLRRQVGNTVGHLLADLAAGEYGFPQEFASLSGPDLKGTICGNPVNDYDPSRTCPSGFECQSGRSYDCGDFTCQSDFKCDEKLDFLCGVENECASNFDCQDAGHGFFCLEDNDCTGGFTCNNGGEACTTGQQYSVNGDTTPGDFLCGFPGDTPDFDCQKDFDCEGTDDFECFRDFDCSGQSSDFDCGTGADFDCGDWGGGSADFDCNENFDCKGNVDCNGSTSYSPPPC